jgi:2-amino-4-hydroxy-6-hydroxymethyldihydropteridine diphosphokinase
MSTVTILIGMGSNIDAEKNLQSAAEKLRSEWPDIRFSSVYRTAPRERADQADFLNAVALMESKEAPADILRILSAIEGSLGKSLPYRFGPRTIDLDLLLVDDIVSDIPALTLPHPRMHERRFVLEPLADLLSPGSRHPRLGKTWSDLLSHLLDQPCERMTGIQLTINSEQLTIDELLC